MSDCKAIIEAVKRAGFQLKNIGSKDEPYYILIKE